MGKLSKIAEKGVLLLTGAAALALFSHFTELEPEKLTITTQTSLVNEQTTNSTPTVKSPSPKTTKATEISVIPAESTTEPLPQLSSIPTAATQNQLVNINTAPIEELMSLPGIGEVKAQAIIDYREQNGSFNSINELMNVSGIGEKTFGKLKDIITI